MRNIGISVLLAGGVIFIGIDLLFIDNNSPQQESLFTTKVAATSNEFEDDTLWDEDTGDIEKKSIQVTLNPVSEKSNTIIKLPSRKSLEKKEEAQVMKKDKDQQIEVLSITEINSEVEDQTDKKSSAVFNQKKEPVKLIFPNKGVEAPIRPVGLNKKGEMDVIDDAINVGWYRYGRTPGGNGNALLSSHRDYKGKAGPLSKLETLNLGDELIIYYDDGSSHKFILESKERYPKDFVPTSVMKIDDIPRTTLITCTGEIVNREYQDRLIAVFKMTN
ncbi:class F sortase [Anaerobacillus isosaccharinicus]|uniref:Class F sortase n=1 Tax=Anaerobacillus isosaccharinicus TaxID=1532552 RepID=A0A1S2KV16_9BACI|nr:class F sortase [Anaerobacillus isosaccharinicus]MBA5583977.1 class F sortase [Anaerobacillus isosaccharinicus]QOY37605.1 class F sortase [Anaerobacillus isosaccharinicus]